MDPNVERFSEIFGYLPQYVFEAPGRTELGGNHTDHQKGMVVCAAVDLSIKAWVSSNGTPTINIHSEGYEPFSVDMNDISVHPDEYGKPISIVRGTISQFVREGLYGFDAYITSDIPAGYGLSSSAAFEILMGTICNQLSGLGKDDIELSYLAQYVENEYFGKPCGLMDPLACTAHSIMAINFTNDEFPDIWDIDFDFKSHGYSLCLVKCGAGHEDLTEEYAAVTKDLKNVCALFGKEVLRDVDEEEFYSRFNEVREKCGDRSALRAVHVFNENKRAMAQKDALRADDMDTYLELVKESGRSSWELLQNVVPAGSTKNQDMAVALALAERALKGKGACRVHGGGFGGTIQAYVPNDMTEDFKKEIEGFLGEGACLYVNIKNINIR